MEMLQLPIITRLLGASNHHVFFIWRNEPGWPVEFVSSNVERVLGVPSRALLSGDVAYSDLVHSDDLPRVIDEVMTAGFVQPVDQFVHKDYRLLKPNGEILWVEDTTVIQRNEQGEVEYFIGFLVDVTERTRLQQQVMQDQQRFNLVLAGTQLGIWDWHLLTGEVIYNSQWARMVGYQLDEIEMSVESWQRLVHPDDLPQCLHDIDQHLAGATSHYENVHRMLHKDGQWRFILDRGMVVERDALGRPTRFTGSHIDITAQKQAELAAQSALKARDVFLANMSHEIRTPLHGILGLAAILERNANSDQKQALQTISKSGENLLTVLNDVLDLAKISEGQLQLHVEPVDLLTVMRQVYELYSERAASKGVKFYLNIGANIPDAVLTDKSRLTQILNNLVSNAIKFTEYGAVSLDLQPTEHGVEILVRDTGIGINKLDEIWLPFSQEDNQLSRKQSGTGLGLSIVKRLADVLGLSIEVLSTPNQGSCFIVAIPLLQGQLPLFQPLVAETKFARLSALNVLLVEDNDVNRMIVVEMLRSLQMTIVEAADGVQALAMVQQHDIDVILMDLHMPNMDGLQASTLIRQLPLAKQPKIIALTADVYPETRAACHDAGMDGFETKPFTLEQLQNAMRRVLHR